MVKTALHADARFSHVPNRSAVRGRDEEQAWRVYTLRGMYQHPFDIRYCGRTTVQHGTIHRPPFRALIGTIQQDAKHELIFKIDSFVRAANEKALDASMI